MQKYRRQIAYLYAYEHGEQLCTAGFVKAEERAGQCRIAVHLKGYCHPGEDAGELYIYFYRKNQAVCIPLGKMESRNGALEWHGCMEADNILGKGICFEETRGIRVCRPGGRDYVAEWDDYPVDPARFVLYPKGGIKCIRCPWFGNCDRSNEDDADRRGKVYEGSNPASEESRKA